MTFDWIVAGERAVAFFFFVKNCTTAHFLIHFLDFILNLQIAKLRLEKDSLAEKAHKTRFHPCSFAL